MTLYTRADIPIIISLQTMHAHMKIRHAYNHRLIIIF